MTRLQQLDNKTLIKSISKRTDLEREQLAEFLEYVAEIDARRLWAEEACSSMHVFLTTQLGFSDPTASKRVSVARAARKFPLLLETIRSGALHLTGAHLLAKHLTPESHVELIEWSKGRTKRAIEKRLAALDPLPEIKPSVRKLPTRTTPPAPSNPSSPPGCDSPTGRPKAPERGSVKPSGERRSRVTFDLDDQELALLDEARDLTGERDPRKVILEALTSMVREKRKKKFAETDRPREKKPPTNVSSRHIPAPVRRDVVKRDGEQCTFRNAQGLRCEETSRLEFHHVEPWAKGGPSTADNVVLLCRAHNHWLARKDFGDRRIDEAMAQGRRSSKSGLSPGKAHTAPDNTTVPVLNPG